MSQLPGMPPPATSEPEDGLPTLPPVPPPPEIVTKPGWYTSEFAAFVGTAAALLTGWAVSLRWLSASEGQWINANLAAILGWAATLSGIVAAAYRYIHSRVVLKQTAMQMNASSYLAATMPEAAQRFAALARIRGQVRY